MGADRPELAARGFGSGQVGEPVDLPVGAHQVAEEGPAPEHEVLGVGHRDRRRGAGVSADPDDPGVRRCRRGGVDENPGRGVDPVAADQDVGLRRGAVGEGGADAAAVDRGDPGQPAAELDGNVVAQGLVAKDLVQAGPADHDAGPFRVAGRTVGHHPEPLPRPLHITM